MHLKSHSQKQQQNRDRPLAATPPPFLRWAHRPVPPPGARRPGGTSLHPPGLFLCLRRLNQEAAVALPVALPAPSGRRLAQVRPRAPGPAQQRLHGCSLGFPSLSLLAGGQRRAPAGRPQGLREGQQQRQQQRRQQLLQRLGDQLGVRLGDGEQLQRERGQQARPLLQPRGESAGLRSPGQRGRASPRAALTPPTPPAAAACRLP